MENDSQARFMREAIELAKKGTGRTNPNPLVGAVIVQQNQIIGQGFHHKYGDLHAERDALRDCLERGNDPSGATMFVTLEPCCHTGKQPPCVEAIVQAKIKKVVVGSRDPNPLVSGKGATFLREHGVEVEQDFFREECDALNFIFFHYITKGTPYVALKYAMTADGKIATVSGASKWISCQESRDFVHQLRAKYSCILCGIGTVLKDDPLLTCRIPGGRNPTRVICDSNLRIPLESNIVQTARDVPTIVACRDLTQAQDFMAKQKALRDLGVQIIQAGSDCVDLRLLLKALAERNLDSVLVEGGSQINFSFLEAGLANRLYCFVAPKIFGGAAPTPVGGRGVLEVADAFALATRDARRIGSDILIEYEFVGNNGNCSQAQNAAASFSQSKNSES
ncbi:MAG: bifunctional diaminohydroxyphosphoribosylaminopyrimidine deaminase/5-amino-6-(5-phosphoribosylamino)uracil reductase RibD [Treponema sp.]|nr:bifunctional diaminohydroxyphosphoribosylaminopyrimidine deaminase/5-amino-6-(5-phosphoribosylamino)uracil reductase RibD [Treponema sp.]